MHNLTNSVHHYIANALSNPFASGGLLLMIFGGVVASLRSIPSKISEWVSSRFTTTVLINQSDPLFNWAAYWLAAQPYANKCRSLIASTQLQKNEGMNSPVGAGYLNRPEVPKIILSPSKGSHIIRYHGTYVIITRGKEGQSQQPSSGVNLGGMDFSKMFTPEEIYFRFLTTNRDLVKNLLEDIRSLSNPPEAPKTHVYVNGYGNWRMGNELPARDPSSVILPEGEYEKLIDDVKSFYENTAFYRKVGIPHRRGYMFSGLPGTGKTSLIRAIASELGAAIYVLNLAESDLSDSHLAQLLSDISVERALIIIEDIDSYFDGRIPRKESLKISFSGLLNAIDGAAACEDRLLFVTTNHRSGIDEALIRPGRIDYELEFTYANDDQIQRMYSKFRDEYSESEYGAFLNNLWQEFPTKQITTAQLQGYLYTHTSH